MSNTITVNGTEHEVSTDPAMPLLWFIRETLNQTGTKYGCGMGLCGSCTVHIDGQSVRSCLTPVSAALGKTVTTIEGLSDTNSHPLQLAWIEYRVPQCGYCQAGQIMNAASFLETNPKPSVEEVDEAMQGNICRCGTYKRIRAAILSVSEQSA